MDKTALPDLFRNVHLLKARLANMQATMEELRRDYDAACDRARTAIDSIEDDDIALGLRLHSVNGLPWHETAALLGISDIRRRCHDYLREGGKTYPNGEIL